MSSEPIDLDSQRGMAAQKATDYGAFLRKCSVMM